MKERNRRWRSMEEMGYRGRVKENVEGTQSQMEEEKDEGTQSNMEEH